MCRRPQARRHVRSPRCRSFPIRPHRESPVLPPPCSHHRIWYHWFRPVLRRHRLPGVASRALMLHLARSRRERIREPAATKRRRRQQHPRRPGRPVHSPARRHPLPKRSARSRYGRINRLRLRTRRRRLASSKRLSHRMMRMDHSQSFQHRATPAPLPQPGARALLLRRPVRHRPISLRQVRLHPSRLGWPAVATPSRYPRSRVKRRRRLHSARSRRNTRTCSVGGNRSCAVLTLVQRAFTTAPWSGPSPHRMRLATCAPSSRPPAVAASSKRTD